MISDITYSDPSDKGIVREYRAQSNRWCDNVSNQKNTMPCKTRDYDKNINVRTNVDEDYPGLAFYFSFENARIHVDFNEGLQTWDELVTAQQQQLQFRAQR